jgi:hypothetical protein
MSAPTALPNGSDTLRQFVNGASELITANSTALNLNKNVHILAGSGNLTGLTLAAPTKIGDEHIVLNSVAFTGVLTITSPLFTGALTITSPVFTGADVYSFPVAGTTALPVITFKAVDVTPTATTRSLKWAVIGAAGGVTIS